MGKIFRLMLLIVVCASACHKDENENENKITPGPTPEALAPDLQFSSLVRFPNNTMAATFTVKGIHGTPPYSYQWIDPPSYTGFGPFTVFLTDDLPLHVNISDADNSHYEFQYVIERADYDSLQHDYRAHFVGSYACQVEFHFSYTDTNGVWQTSISYYQDTILVSPDYNFTKFQFSDGIPVVDYYYPDSTFSGYHTHGNFRNDSIYLNYFISPVATQSWYYTGVKIQ